MTRDPFLRLALIVTVSAYAVALAALWKYLGWPYAVFAGVGGTAGAALLTLELTPSPVKPDRHARRRQPKDGTAGFDRQQA